MSDHVPINNVPDGSCLALISLDAARDEVFWTDSEGRFVYANRSACQALGYTREELLAMSVSDVCPDMPREKWPEHWLELKAAGNMQMEVRQRSRSGEDMLIELSATYTLFEGNEYSCAFARDITGRKRVEQALTDAGKQLEAIFDTMQAGIILVNPQGVITFANQRMASMFGVSLKELIGTAYSAYLDPEQRSEGESRMSRLIAGEMDHVHYERLYLRANGERFWGYLSGRRLEDEHGNLISLVGVIANISEVKRVEDMLRISEQKFSKAFNNAPLLMSISEIETGRYLDVNNRFCEISGFSRSDAIGRTSIEIGWLSSVERERMIGLLDEKGMIQDMELNLTAKDGTLVVCLYSAQIIQVDGCDRLLSIALDITERKRTYAMLEEERQRYRLLVEQSSAWIWKTDPSLRHIYSNDNVESILGYSAREICSLDILDLVHPDDHELLRKTVERAMVEKCGWQGLILRWLARSGSWRYIESTGNPVFDADGKLAGLQGVDMDVTDRLQLQQEREKGQRLESLGLLAGGIAHDFNNLLTGIAGNLSLARMMIKSDHRASERLAECERAASRASELTRQLLTFARGGEPVKKVLDLARLASEAVSFILRGSNVRGELELGENLWAVEADEGQIVQVLNNLLLNAVQAMPEGGVVTVHAENSVSENPSQPCVRYVRLAVRDTGVGIPSDLLEKVFDPYYTTKPTGSGLGLASVYSIVNRHGGTVSVTSRPGGGSEFVVCLPAVEKIPAHDTDRPGEPVELTGCGRVLVMDDEEMLRDVTSLMLIELGCQPEVCSDGAQAVEMYRAALEQGDPFRIVILDLTVPGGMGGLETARRIKLLDEDARLIVSSGYSNDAVMSDLGKHGFCGSVRKPFSMTDLAEELERVRSCSGLR